MSAIGEERGQGVVGTAPAAQAAGDFYLVAIGIDEYLHWPKLKTAVNDAQAVEQALRENYGFDEQHITALYNAQATGRNIITALRQLAQQLQPDDSLVVFYAGHGKLDELTSTGAWVPVDAALDDATSWLDNSKIKATIGAMKARHVLLVSDSCFAGDFFRGDRGGLPAITDEYVRSAFGKMSRQAITSGGLEPVTDEGAGRHSWFTHFLLKELQENTMPYLLPSDLWNRIKGGVAENAKQQPQLGVLEGAGGEIGGEFVFFRKGAGGNLDAAIKKKREQMTALEKMEQEAREAAAKEQALQKEKEAELKKVDDQIAELRERLNDEQKAPEPLEQLHSLLLEKQRRETDLSQLRADELAKRKNAFERDYASYLEIRANGQTSPDIVDNAWRIICDRWAVQGTSGKPGYLTWKGDSVSVRKPGDLQVVQLGVRCKLELVWIPPGEFDMGSNSEGDEERPIHRVKITKAFWLGKYEVTQEQYEAMAGTSPSRFRAPRYPVDKASWYDSQRFVDILNAKVGGAKFQLPSEEQWEYACRAGTTSKYYTGETEADLKKAAWADFYKPHPVGQKQPNSWGLYDMLGNVWEWCSNWKYLYSDKSTDKGQWGPTSEGPYKPLRGNTSAWRLFQRPDEGQYNNCFGFRVAREEE
jgi:formylglycine-generating enzyme required for sulfatase activity